MSINITARDNAPKAKSNDITLRVGQFVNEKNGDSFPTIEFQRGNARPFTLGFAKIELVLECQKELRQIIDGKLKAAPSDVQRAARETAQSNATFSTPSDEITREQVAQYLVGMFPQVSMIDALSMADDKRAITAANEYYAKQRENAPQDKLGALLATQSHVPASASTAHSAKNKGTRKTADVVQERTDDANELNYPKGKVMIACIVNGKTIKEYQDKLNKSAFLKKLVGMYDTQVLQSHDGKLTRALVSGVDDLQANSAPRFDSMVRRNFLTVTPR